MSDSGLKKEEGRIAFQRPGLTKDNRVYTPGVHFSSEHRAVCEYVWQTHAEKNKYWAVGGQYKQKVHFTYFTELSRT